MDVVRVATRERAYLRKLVYGVGGLSPVYYLQTLSIWIRIKNAVPVEHYQCLLAMCLNLAVHYLGPQSVCRSLRLFRTRSPPLLKTEELQVVHKALIGFTPAQHLQQWQLARNVQWYIVLQLLQGRVQ